MPEIPRILDHWPGAAALALSALLIGVSAEEKLGIEIWPRLAETPSDPAPVPPAPIAPPLPPGPAAPYGPVPGWDDRTPVEYLSQVFDLDDPYLAQKLSGIGPVFWIGGQASGTLIARDVVLTTGHLFARDGYWEGASPDAPLQPDPSNGSIYLPACQRSYDFLHVELGSMAPRHNLGRDYAIARLSEPACDAARPLAAEILADTAIAALRPHEAILLNLGSYRFADLPRYANHPLFRTEPPHHPYHVFGVRCRMSGHSDTGGAAGLILTDGCDSIPGGSGGPLLVSLDAGATYRIVGVLNSYSTENREYNNFTRITGRLAAHLTRFVPDVFDHPQKGD